MAVSARFVDASRANSMLGRKTGEGGNFGGRRNVGVMASVACPGLKEEYKTLRLKPDATQKEVKKAYRRLALQYHPDVCKADNCTVRFHKINQAYQTLMSSLFEVNKQEEEYYDNNDSGMDEWEEWMGWEGACPSRDYSNHINYYV